VFPGLIQEINPTLLYRVQGGILWLGRQYLECFTWVICLEGKKKEEPEGALFESVPNWAPYCYSTFYKIWYIQAVL
jgi:hypothetical protein